MTAAQIMIDVLLTNFFNLHHSSKAGGEGGIRTPVRLSPEAVFKTAAIDHSATSPSQIGLPSRSSKHFPNFAFIFQRRLARQEGLEPPTNGFGDRYSTN
jgi:hypothetical protein